MRGEKNKKHMLKKDIFQVGKMWQFGGISDLCMS
jgi:hypothetical protein